MKQIFALLACLLISNILSAQTNPNEVFLHSKDHHYTILRDDTTFVYIMQMRYDRRESAMKPYLHHIDTILRNKGNNFTGVNCRLIQENNAWFLFQKRKRKERKTRLDTAQNVTEVYYKLNEAYYIAQYLKMSSEIDKTYPLSQPNHYEAYESWNNLPYKIKHYLMFQNLANNKIDAVKHAIMQRLEKYESVKKFIAQNAKTASYEVLRDTLSKLSTGKGRQQDIEKWRYYLRAVHEIAEQKPEFFFKLAEDLPDNQHDIFFSIDHTEKELLAKLKSVVGQESIKKKFIKEKRSEKRFAIIGVTSYVVMTVLFYGALLVWIF